MYGSSMVSVGFMGFQEIYEFMWVSVFQGVLVGFRDFHGSTAFPGVSGVSIGFRGFNGISRNFGSLSAKFIEILSRFYIGFKSFQAV